MASIVMDGGLPSRPAWECALMLKLQEELKSGNIWGNRYGQDSHHSTISPGKRLSL
jgi:hypothetical protein